jgi:hypothetical protein
VGQLLKHEEHDEEEGREQARVGVQLAIQELHLASCDPKLRGVRAQTTALGRGRHFLPDT